MSGREKWLGLGAALSGGILVLVLHWQIFFFAPTESTMGVAQRIFYLHPPTAWVTFLAFGLVALCSVVYLWLEDERLDMAAVALAEGGMVFATIFLTTGPLWGKFAWGTYWAWEPRLTLSLLLWFIFLGYFIVRRAAENPEQGKRFAAVVGIVGALDIPLIHLSVEWFPSLHPAAVVMRPQGPTAETDMLITLATSFAAFTLLFFGLVAFRYRLEKLHRRAESLSHSVMSEAT